jgi:DUF177 domain-containing protein
MCAMVDLRSYPLHPGQAAHTPIPLELQRFTLGGDPYDPLPPRVEGDLKITRMASGRLFDLAFGATLFGPCQRCLNEARLDLEVEGREYQADAPEPGAEDDMTTPYLDGELLDGPRKGYYDEGQLDDCVYIYEGTQIGYLPGGARYGWDV